MIPSGRLDLLALCVACLALLLASVSAFLWRFGRHLSGRQARQLAWLAVPVALLVILVVWSAIDAPHVSKKMMLFASLCNVATGAAVLMRVWAETHMVGDRTKRTPILSVLRIAALLLADSVLAFLALELPWNDALFQMSPSLVAVNVCIVGLFVLTAFFLGQRTGLLVGVVVLVAGGFGIAQHFVVEFKGASILPSDLMALGTAAAVSGGYEYQLSDGILAGMAAVGLGWASASFLAPVRLRPAHARRTMRALPIAVNLLAAGACVATGLYTFEHVDFVADLGLTNNYFSSKDIYKVQGFAASFAHLASTMGVDPPEGYSLQGAEDLEGSYSDTYQRARGESEGRLAAEEQFEQVRPSFVVIMNESFTDLSIFDGLGVGYAGPEQFMSIPDALMMGNITPSNYGGGTCNSEFQFLTGFSSAYLGAAVFPYTAFDLSGMPSLARQLSDMGYETTAMHPNLATNWNRDVALADLGFDEFLSIEDFAADAQTFHAGISDAETYAKVIEVLQESESPQFIFDITMQNHGGYEMGNIPAGSLPDTQYPGLDDATRSQVNEFIACIDESDRAFSDFLDELRNMDRPIVVVMFGDHQPGFTRTLNDTFYAGEAGLDHDARAYITPYCIWANYDVEGCDQVSERKDMGIHALGSAMLDLAGAPLTSLQQAAVVGNADVQGLNALGYKGTDGVWHELDYADAPQVVNDYEWMQYLEMIDRPRG